MMLPVHNQNLFSTFSLVSQTSKQLHFETQKYYFREDSHILFSHVLKCVLTIFPEKISHWHLLANIDFPAAKHHLFNNLEKHLNGLNWQKFQDKVTFKTIFRPFLALLTFYQMIESNNRPFLLCFYVLCYLISNFSADFFNVLTFELLAVKISQYCCACWEIQQVRDCFSF